MPTMVDAARPRYEGPLDLARALSAFARSPAADAGWSREGLRPDVEYRDLGLAAATGGRVGARHIRAIAPLPAPTGWHWHDMHAHFVYVLAGWLVFRFAGIDGDVRLSAGDGLSQPAGVPHDVIARSDDLEVIEINVPADYGTFDVGPSSSPGERGR